MAKSDIIYKTDLIEEIQKALNYSKYIIEHLYIKSAGHWAQVITHNTDIDDILSPYDDQMRQKRNTKNRLKSYEIKGRQRK